MTDPAERVVQQEADPPNPYEREVPAKTDGAWFIRANRADAWDEGYAAGLAATGPRPDPERLREIAGHLAVAAVHLRHCQKDADASILTDLAEEVHGWASGASGERTEPAPTAAGVGPTLADLQRAVNTLAEAPVHWSNAASDGGTYRLNGQVGIWSEDDSSCDFAYPDDLRLVGVPVPDPTPSPAAVSDDDYEPVLPLPEGVEGPARKPRRARRAPRLPAPDPTPEETP